MPRPTSQLREDVQKIWWAGVHAVLPERLIPEHVSVRGNLLTVADDQIDLDAVRQIAVVGAGKAAGGMAAALEAALGPNVLREKHVTGWVNIPTGSVVATTKIHLHPARPAGINEPRIEGVAGTLRILEIVKSLGDDDLCICLLSGGGSALMPAPVPGISLEDKIWTTRLMSAAGANIEQLNTVRRRLSLVKGGGLARACRAGRVVTLIISDVLGDSLEAIASGPTVDCESTPADALTTLADLHVLDDPKITPVVTFLRKSLHDANTDERQDDSPTAFVTNLVLANNATAVDAAGAEAERLGYSHAMMSARTSEGPAEDVGRHLAGVARHMRGTSGPDCLISGGEPTVSLTAERERGRGGRNQQLALAALAELSDGAEIALLAGGTDGEDGPTDAAGALVTAEVIATANRLQLDPRDFLRHNDAYSFFGATGGLFKTGPTHTNVCDLRVVVVNGPAAQSHHH